ncbi:hypothetical protein [Mycobacterium avium]|uniref:hypothetical protein n=1 Tax=Mycobacterium avium TaxID=1764 RepID=UPI00111C5D50|nr:hypothetical protein [Mycobacterium avium]
MKTTALGVVARIAAATAARRRRTAPRPAEVTLRSAELPAALLDRLRHPSAPAGGYTVRWDPATNTTRWQPNIHRP